MEENKREESHVQSPSNEEKKNYLMVVNPEEKSVGAVTKLEDNKVETQAPVKKNEKHFMDVGHNTDLYDVLVTVMKNFINQTVDPTPLVFFKASEEEYREVAEACKKQLNGKGTPETSDIIKNHVVDSETVKTALAEAQEIVESEAAKKSQMVDLDKLDMTAMAEKGLTREMLEQLNESGALKAIIGTFQADNQQQQETQKSYYIKEETIDWESLSQWKVSKDLFQANGCYEKMLNGEESPAIRFETNLLGSRVKVEGVFAFTPSLNNDGSMAVTFEGIKSEPNFKRPLGTHYFTPEDEKNLKETGQMGRTARLKDNKTGEFYDAIISLHPVTKAFRICPVSSFTIKDEYCNAPVTETMKAKLRSGETIPLEGATSKNGQDLHVDLVLNALTRRVEFIFKNNTLELTKDNKLNDKQLTPQQVKELNDNKTIKVEDMVWQWGSNKGELYDRFVTKDPYTGLLSESRFNPQADPENPELIIPKVLNHVKLTDTDQKTLAEGGWIYLKDMIGRNNEPFSSFVMLHPVNGDPKYSSDPNRFDLEVKAKIPSVIFGHTVKASEMGDLQTGKSLYFDDMVNPSTGKPMPGWAYANPRTGTLRIYDNDPLLRQKQAQKEEVKPVVAPPKKKSGIHF